MQNQAQPIELQGSDQPGGPAGVDTPPADFGSWLGPSMLLLGVAVLTWTMIRMAIRNRRRASLSSGTPDERLETIRRQARQRARVDAFAADAHELVQRLASQLDLKAERVEQLLEEADEKIRKLERMRRDASNPHADTLSETSDRPDPVAAKVYEMADQGAQPMEIAEQLNQQLGQIELILALRRA